MWQSPAEPSRGISSLGESVSGVVIWHLHGASLLHCLYVIELYNLIYVCVSSQCGWRVYVLIVCMYPPMHKTSVKQVEIYCSDVELLILLLVHINIIYFNFLIST